MGCLSDSETAKKGNVSEHTGEGKKRPETLLDILQDDLMDTCLTAQDRYKAYLDYFRIKY